MTRIINTTMTDALMFVGGGVVGAGLALLLAPHSGRRTRREIVRVGKTLENKSVKVINGFAGSVADFVETLGKRPPAVPTTDRV